jgi:hypothetical protein
LKWLHNVWRTKNQPVMKPGRYRPTEILWYTQQEAVWKEIASVLNVDSADTNTPGWFENRTKASKNIIAKMSAEEKKKLEDECERMWKEGLPIDIQRK